MSRPKSEKITRLNYCQYLLSSQTNYTITSFAVGLLNASLNGLASLLLYLLTLRISFQ